MSSAPATRCCPTDQPVPPSAGGAPTGESLYLTGPTTSKTGIVLVGDIFGPLDNSKRFADLLGAAGHLVVMPDYFGAAAWDVANFPPPSFESDEWKRFYAFITAPEPHRSRTRRAIALLRQLGCTSVAAFGMCWGACTAFDVAGEGLADAVITAHPSFFSEAYIKAVTRIPVCVLPSKDDPPMEDVVSAVEAHPQYHVYKRYDALVHGFFAARYTPESCSDAQKSELEDAVQTTLAFLDKVLH